MSSDSYHRLHDRVSRQGMWGLRGSCMPAPPTPHEMARNLLPESMLGGKRSTSPTVGTDRSGRAAELAGHFERLATDRRMGHRARRYYDAHCTRLKRCRALARLVHRTAVSTTHDTP